MTKRHLMQGALFSLLLTACALGEFTTVVPERSYAAPPT